MGAKAVTGVQCGVKPICDDLGRERKRVREQGRERRGQAAHFIVSNCGAEPRRKANKGQVSCSHLLDAEGVTAIRTDVPASLYRESESFRPMPRGKTAGFMGVRSLGF